MKLIMLWVFLLPFLEQDTAEPTVSELRALYFQAAQSNTAAANLSLMVKGVSANSPPILLCYQGASYMMEAKYAFNPLIKFTKFKKGKTTIEQAIRKNPEQPEMRFIRFTIQTNLPAFLGYNSNIQADKRKLLDAVTTMEDNTLKHQVINYLIASKKCTKEEIKKLPQ